MTEPARPEWVENRRLRFRRRPDLQVNAVDDGCVVYQPDKDRVHFLNLSAAVVLELCDGSNGFREIEEKVAAVYGIKDAGRYLADEVLERFVREGLVSVEESADG